MSNKLFSPKQEAVRRQAWQAYLSAFEREGLPIPADGEGYLLVRPPRLQVRAGMSRTVWANGKTTQWASIAEQWAEYLKDRDAATGATLHADVWAKRHGEHYRGGNA
jgi:hypothetical protein